MMWEYIIKGGFLLLIIGTTSVIALAIFFERFFYLRKTENDNIRFLDNIFQKIKEKQIPEAMHYCDEANEVVGSHLAKVALIKADQSRSELKELIEEAANREIPKLEAKIPALGTIASVAPLLGLLGTVLGMIDSLSMMEAAVNAGNQGTASLLGGIWTALITTAAGLIVAIPALTGYNYLVTKVNHVIIFLKNKANELVDIIISQRKE